MPVNDRAARGFSRRSLFRLVPLLAALLLLWVMPAGADSGRYPERLLELTNQYRVANGRPPLAPSVPLARAAQGYAEFMARQRFFGHDAPNGSTMTSRIEAGGYTGWSSLGENLGAGYKTPEEVFTGWLASDTHRENILNPNYREIGIGYSTIPDSPYVDYWVENFGARPGTVAAQTITKPRFVLGFQAFHDAAPKVVGDPLEDVWHLGQSSDSTLAIQRTTRGILLWLKPLNQMIFVTESLAYSYRDGRLTPLSEGERQVFGALAGAPAPTPTAPRHSEEPDQAGN